MTKSGSSPILAPRPACVRPDADLGSSSHGTESASQEGNGRRVLVTGGSGFIGSHVVDVLARRGYEPHIFDLRESLHHEPGSVAAVVGDATDAPALESAMEGSVAVIHLSAMADVGHVQADPVGAEAGVRKLDRVHAYLDNLSRLGLIWFSREALRDVRRYQVLEAQPEVVEAMERAGRGRTVRRSIHLTAFGEGFCEAALPLDTGEIDALPREAEPDSDDETARLLEPDS